MRYFLTAVSLLLFPSFVFSASSFSAKMPASLQLAEKLLGTNLDSSFYYSTSFIQAKDEDTKKQDVAFAYYIAGSAEYLFGNLSYSDSLEAFALKTAEEVKDDYLLGICHQMYGKILKVEKRFESSLFHLTEAEKFFTKANDPLKKIEIIVDVAEYYRAIANFPKAEEYLKEAEDEESKLQTQDDDLKANLLNRKAAIYDEMGKVDEALELSKASLVLSEKTNNLHYQASSDNEIGFILWKKHDMKCFDYYTKAIEIWKSINYHYYKASTQMNLAMYYLGKQDYPKTKEIIMGVLAESEKKGWKGVELSAHQQLVALYQILGEKESIPAHIIRSQELDLFITKESSGLSLLDMQEKYSAEQNKRIAVEKEEEAKIAEAKLETESKNNLYLTIGVGLALLLGTALGFAIGKRKRKLE